MQITTTIAADQVNAFLLALNNMIPIAQNSAKQAAVDTAHDAVIAALTAENHLPITVVSHRVMTDINTPVGKVWIGTLPVNTNYLKSFKESGHGAYAGEFFFDGAFIVDKNGIHLAKRVSKKRYPIEYVASDALTTNNLNDNTISAIEEQYMQVFIDKMDSIND